MESTLYQQSANTLFHFMDKMIWLKDMLSEKKIIPRYCDESFAFLDKRLKNIAFPEKCFCDLYLEKMASHMKKYGKFGIGFNKRWLIEKGVQPIQYLNEKSIISKEYKTWYIEYINKYGDQLPLQHYNDKLFKLLSYVKPLEGKMERTGEEQNNFHDEHEWRYVPQVRLDDEKIKPFLYGMDSDFENRKLASDSIATIDNYSIGFEYVNVKYILVPDFDYCREICDFIYNYIASDIEDKLELIAKIIVFNHTEEDWYYGTGT